MRDGQDDVIFLVVLFFILFTSFMMWGWDDITKDGRGLCKEIPNSHYERVDETHYNCCFKETVHDISGYCFRDDCPYMVTIRCVGFEKEKE